MSQSAQSAVATIPFSPILLRDRLLTLAQDADSAGYRGAAECLAALVYGIFDEASGHV